MKFLFDLFPVILFFIAFKLADIYVATAVAIGATFLQIGLLALLKRRIEPMLWVSLAIIVVFGGATLALRDETFIKWKPTLVNWLFAAAFLGSQYVGKQSLLKRMMASNISLPEPVWLRLNMSWVSFFAAMGAANLYVAFNYDTDTWVNFKLFGMMGLTVVFIIAQAFYLSRHIKPDQET